MKQILKKLRLSRGETLVETLVATLIISLSIMLMVTMVTSAMNIDRAARAEDEQLFGADGELTKAESGAQVESSPAPWLELDLKKNGVDDSAPAPSSTIGVTLYGADGGLVSFGVTP